MRFGVLSWLAFAAILCRHAGAETPQPEVPADLEAAVTAYWKALEANDKVTALQYVYPEDRNNFLNRRTAPFRDVRVERFEPEGLDEYRVTVGLELLLPNGVFRSRSRDRWVRTEQGWRIRVAPPEAVVEHILKATRQQNETALPPRLEVLPREVHFYALSPRQPAGVTIRNGLDVEVRVLEIRFDCELLELVGRVDVVPPRSRGRILFRYKGADLKTHNLATEIGLVLEVAGERREFQVPALCNYMNQIQRWILEQAGKKRQP